MPKVDVLTASSATMAVRPSFWVAASSAYTLVEVPRALDNRIRRPTVTAPVGVAYSSAGVWVVGNLSNSVALVDPKTGKQLGEADVGQNPFAITAHGRSAWVTNLADGTVTRVDAR